MSDEDATSTAPLPEVMGDRALNDSISLDTPSKKATSIFQRIFHSDPVYVVGGSAWELEMSREDGSDYSKAPRDNSFFTSDSPSLPQVFSEVRLAAEDASNETIPSSGDYSPAVDAPDVLRLGSSLPVHPLSVPRDKETAVVAPPEKLDDRFLSVLLVGGRGSGRTSLVRRLRTASTKLYGGEPWTKRLTSFVGDSKGEDELAFQYSFRHEETKVLPDYAGTVARVVRNLVLRDPGSVGLDKSVAWAAPRLRPSLIVLTFPLVGVKQVRQRQVTTHDVRREVDEGARAGHERAGAILIHSDDIQHLRGILRFISCSQYRPGTTNARVVLAGTFMDYLTDPSPHAVRAILRRLKQLCALIVREENLCIDFGLFFAVTLPDGDCIVEDEQQFADLSARAATTLTCTWAKICETEEKKVDETGRDAHVQYLLGALPQLRKRDDTVLAGGNTLWTSLFSAGVRSLASMTRSLAHLHNRGELLLLPTVPRNEADPLSTHSDAPSALASGTLTCFDPELFCKVLTALEVVADVCRGARPHLKWAKKCVQTLSQGAADSIRLGMVRECDLYEILNTVLSRRKAINEAHVTEESVRQWINALLQCGVCVIHGVAEEEASAREYDWSLAVSSYLHISSRVFYFPSLAFRAASNTSVAGEALTALLTRSTMQSKNEQAPSDSDLEVTSLKMQLSPPVPEGFFAALVAVLGEWIQGTPLNDALFLSLSPKRTHGGSKSPATVDSCFAVLVNRAPPVSTKLEQLQSVLEFYVLTRGTSEQKALNAAVFEQSVLCRVHWLLTQQYPGLRVTAKSPAEDITDFSPVLFNPEEAAALTQRLDAFFAAPSAQ